MMSNVITIHDLPKIQEKELNNTAKLFLDSTGVNLSNDIVRYLGDDIKNSSFKQDLDTIKQMPNSLAKEVAKESILTLHAYKVVNEKQVELTNNLFKACDQITEENLELKNVNKILADNLLEVGNNEIVYKIQQDSQNRLELLKQQPKSNLDQLSMLQLGVKRGFLARSKK